MEGIDQVSSDGAKKKERPHLAGAVNENVWRLKVAVHQPGDVVKIRKPGGDLRNRLSERAMVGGVRP